MRAGAVGPPSPGGAPGGLAPAADAVIEQVEIVAKYAGYIDRQEAEIAKLRAAEDQPLPADFDYQVVKGPSNEVKQKLNEVRPATATVQKTMAAMKPTPVTMLRACAQGRTRSPASTDLKVAWPASSEVNQCSRRPAPSPQR